MKKITPLIFIALLAVGLTGELFNYFENAKFNLISNIAFEAGRLGGIILFTINFSFLKARPYIQLILGFLCLIIIGMLFKASHWPYSKIIFYIGLYGIPITYIIKFIRKQSKKRLDFLKVMWVLSIFVKITFSINHWPFGEELFILENFLFVIMFSDFVYQSIKTNKQSEMQNNRI